MMNARCFCAGAAGRLAVTLCAAAAGAAFGATPVGGNNATSTYTQGADLWGPEKTIDGIASGTFTSWAIARDGSGNAQALPETIVWETANDVDLPAGGLVKFTLCQHDFIPIAGHNIGRFRLSYTTDARDDFADGLGVGGDVDANWTLIRPLAMQSDGGETMVRLPDDSILVQGGANGYSIYTVVTRLVAGGITGFRMEAMEHRTLPFRGPGRQAVNGNMHLSEFKVELTSQKRLRPGVC